MLNREPSFAWRSARRIFPAMVCVVAWFAPLPLQAQARFAPEEIALLPAYCRSHPNVTTERGPEAAAVSKTWHDRLGDPYRAIHHYCWGLMLTNRARLTARNATDRRRGLEGSLGEFEFILRYSPREFVLLPEILTKRGENLLDLGRVPEGMRDFQRAAEVKPDYWPPYASASDYYMKVGDYAKAREWLEKGLAAAPDAKPLQRRLSVVKGGSGAAKSTEKPAKAPLGQKPAPEAASPTDDKEAQPPK